MFILPGGIKKTVKLREAISQKKRQAVYGWQTKKKKGGPPDLHHVVGRLYQAAYKTREKRRWERNDVMLPLRNPPESSRQVKRLGFSERDDPQKSQKGSLRTNEDHETPIPNHAQLRTASKKKGNKTCENREWGDNQAIDHTRNDTQARSGELMEKTVSGAGEAPHERGTEKKERSDR